MKTNIVLLLMLINLIISCQKQQVFQVPISSLNHVSLVKGRLHFPSQNQFNEAYLAINSNARLDLSAWHDDIGFYAMKKLNDAVQIDFEKIKTHEAYQQFCNQYKDYLYITSDSSISTQGYQPFLSQLLNVDGEIYIDKSLIKYTNTHKIRIEDGSEEKLKLALNDLVSDEKNGIWIEERTDITNSFANSRYCHPNDVWHTIHGHSGVMHRIYAHYNVENINNGALTYNVLTNVAPMSLRSYFNVHIKSEYQGFLQKWYRKRTTITWNVGWGVLANDVSKSPNFAHGTGWTVSNVSEINYTYDIRPSGLLIYWNQKMDNNYRFDYCSSFLQTPVMNGSKYCQ